MIKSNPEIRAAIQDQIESLRFRSGLCAQIAAVLFKFNGKKITKAIATAVEKELPGYSVYFEKAQNQYSSYSLRVWGGPSKFVPYSNNLSFTLGYGSAEFFDFEKFKEFSSRYSSQEFADKLEAQLPFLDELVLQYQQAEAMRAQAIKSLGELAYFVVK